MSDDIVSRLRVWYVHDDHTRDELERFHLLHEAADVIEDRDARIDHLMEVGNALLESLRRHITTCEYFGLQSAPSAVMVIANWQKVCEETSEERHRG